VIWTVALVAGVVLILVAIPVEAVAHTRPREVTALILGRTGGTLATLGTAGVIIPDLIAALTS
jgi:hypothetical protein